MACLVLSWDTDVVGGCSGCTGTVLVTVADQVSAITPSSYFSYTDLIQPPFIAAIVPLSGPTSGGTAVTIIGSGFSLDAVVTFIERDANLALTGVQRTCDWQSTPGMSCNATTLMYV